MIVKTIKKYKKGKSFRYEIAINKQDLEDLNNIEQVTILSNNEYESLQDKIKILKETITNQDKEINQLHEKLNNIEENNKTIKQLETSYKETIEKLNQQQDKNIKELNKNLHETIKDLDQQHSNQLKQTYDEFNKKISNYIQINQVQNQALKQILELGFIELLRNKHKKIAQKNIKELDQKPIYELVEKKE